MIQRLALEDFEGRAGMRRPGTGHSRRLDGGGKGPDPRGGHEGLGRLEEERTRTARKAIESIEAFLRKLGKIA